MAANVLNPVENELLVSVFGQAAVSGMTLSQVKSLYSLVKKCPENMADAVMEVDLKAVTDAMRHYGLSTGRGSSTSWRTLLSAVSDVLPSIYQLSKEESTMLLNGLCKSIRSQVVSIPLFMVLLSTWKSSSSQSVVMQGASSPSSASPSPGKMQTEEIEKKQAEERFREISSTLNLSIPELMYIFDLIRERLSVELTKISTSSNSITMTDFEIMLRKTRTVIDPKKLDKLVAGIMSSAVGAPGVPTPPFGDKYEIVDKSGNLNASNLLAFSVFVEQGHIFQLPGYKTMKEKTMQTRISTHLLRAVKKAWPIAHARFVASKVEMVSALDFEKKLREGGTLLSTDDLQRIWEAVSMGVGIGSFDGMGALVTLSELDTFVQGFVEVDKDPRSFVMMRLMDKGEGAHNLRKMREGPHQVFDHKVDLTWGGDGDGVGDADASGAAEEGEEARLGGISPRKKHFEKKKVRAQGSGLPWEETFVESGHELSQQEAQRRQREENAQKHHFTQSDTDVALPWMDQFQNEGTSSSNLQRRITLRVHGLSPNRFQTFVSALKKYAHAQDLNTRRGVTAGRALAPEDAVDYTHVTGSEIVSRVTLREALAEAGVFCSPSESSDLFLNVARYCAGYNRRVKAGTSIDHPVTISEVFRWMGATQGVGESGREVLSRYATMVGLAEELDIAARDTSLHSGGDSGAGGDPSGEAAVDDVFVSAFEDQLHHGLPGPALHNQKNEESSSSVEVPSHTSSKAKYHGSESASTLAAAQPSPPGPSRRVNASELRGAGVDNEGDVPPSPPPPPSPAKADFIFGSEASTPSRPPPRHLRSSSIFTAPHPQEEANGRPVERRVARVSRAPPSRDIFGALTAAEEAGGGGADSAWPKPLPSWQQAAAERARGGGNSASRIFGVDEEDVEVLAPPSPPPPTGAGGGAAAASHAMAAKQTAGSLGGAAGTVSRSTDGQVGTEDVIAVLQTKRANIALVFRRLAAMSDHGSGLVRLQDFGAALPDLVGGHVGSLLKVQPDVCWHAVCDIAGRPYTSDQNATANTIHYNDVTRFLDRVQRDAETGMNGAQIMRSLKDKCFRSRDLGGDKLKLITLTPQLRQRQRQRVLTNRSRSKGVTGAQNSYEFVNAHDLIDLFASIDLHMSTSEARWLCDQSATSDDKIGMLEPTTRLSSVVQYLSANLLA